jgi:hypothetical protein
MTRVLSSTITESGSPVQISWVDFYKAADLDGQILRHVLIAGGTNLFRVESGGTTTQLTGAATNPITTSRTTDLVHTSQKYLDFLLIQNQNPDLVGQGDDPVKYDGADIQLWGIRAPGTTETVREAFDDSTAFTATNGAASNELASSSGVTRDGDAVKFVKAGASTSGDIARTDMTDFDASASGEQKVYIWVYIPRGELPKIATSGRGISVHLASGNAFTDFYRFDTKNGALFEGWNLITMDTSAAPTAEAGDPAASGGAFDNTAVDSIKCEVVTNNAADVVNLRWDRLYTTDEGRATATDGAAGSNQLTAGDYGYKTTFVNKYGYESNAGPNATVTVATTGNQVDLTAIPTSTDPQVISRKIYRTVADGAIWLLLTTLSDNTTATYTDTTDDLSLGQTSPPEAGSVNLDASPPIKAGIIKVWKKTVFLAGDPLNPETVYFSEDDEPESFPTLNAVALDDKITAMYETLSGLVVETETGKWQVIGDNPDFRFDKVVSGIGCVGRRAAGEARLAGYAADRDGLYLYDLQDPIKISEVIRDKYDAINRANIETMHIHHMKSLNSLFQFNADSSGKFTNNFVYQYLQDIQSRADLINGWWWTLQLPSASETTNGNALNILDAEEIEDSNGDFHMYAGADDGMLYELFDSSTKNFTDAAGKAIAITTEFQSKYIRAGDKVQGVAIDSHMDPGGSGRIDPRWIELRRTGTVDSTWDVLIETADGSATGSSFTSRSSTTVSIPFGSNESLKRISIASSALTPAEYTRVKVTNNQQNVDDTILAVRLYYYLRPGQFEM